MSRMRLRLLLLLTVVLMAVWLLCPVPGSSAIKTDVVARQELPSSTIRDVRFVCRQTSDWIAIDVSPSLSQGRLEIDVRDMAGQVLAGPWIVTGNKSDHLTVVADGGFTAGQTFRLQCREYEVLGVYRLAIEQPRVLIVAHRYLAGIVTLVAGWSVTVVLGLLGIAGKRVLILRRVFGGFAFLASPVLVYAVLHEGGHILGLMSMDAWDPSSTSVFPVNGQMPHVAAASSAHLTPFELATVAIAGPLLPTLLAYGSFALWRSRIGNRWRAQHLQADIRWSFLTATMLLPQVVGTPISFALPASGDFSVFVENVGLPLSASNVGLAMVAVVNAVLTACIVKHVICRIRGMSSDAAQCR